MQITVTNSSTPGQAVDVGPANASEVRAAAEAQIRGALGDAMAGRDKRVTITPMGNGMTEIRVKSADGSTKTITVPSSLVGTTGEGTGFNPETGDIRIRPQMPKEVLPITISFFSMIAVVVVLGPIARAWARRMDRRTVAPPQLPPEFAANLTQIAQTVDAMAIEIERISEAQRFLTKLQSGAPAQKLEAKV